MVRIASASELSAFLRDAGGPVDVVGSDSRRGFRLAGERGTRLEVGITGIVEHMASDQVVVVGAGTPLAELDAALREKGQALPWHDPIFGLGGTVGGALAMNLPNGLESRCGTWRDWVLGMTVVRADGQIAKAGSRSVKNVAGYDVHKFLVGSRGSLAVIAEVILRTLPVGAIPASPCEVLAAPTGGNVWIQRTDRARAAELREKAQGRVLAFDLETATLWSEADAGPDLPGWWLASNSKGGRMAPLDSAAAHYLRRAKQEFDPTGKLNPGEFGEEAR